MLQYFTDWINKSLSKLTHCQATEKEIRDWMMANGHRNSALQVSRIELYAFKRPGWEQVFRFQVESSRGPGDKRLWFGILQSDERYGQPRLQLFAQARDRDVQLKRCSHGMIIRRRG